MESLRRLLAPPSPTPPPTAEKSADPTDPMAVDPVAPPRPPAISPLLYRINERDDDNLTALHLAVLNGHLDCAETLLAHGARQLSAEGSRPIQQAPQVGALPGMAPFAVGCLRALLAHGASAYDRDDFHRTAVHWAAQHGLADSVRLLLDAASAEATAQREASADQDRRRAAAAAGRAPAASDDGAAPVTDPSLMEADVEVPPPALGLADKQGNTPIHLAARAGCATALEELLRVLTEDPCRDAAAVAKAVERKNKAGQTALHRAAEGGHADCARLLVAAVSPLVDVRCKKGRTAGELALRRGHRDVARDLGCSTIPLDNQHESKPPISAAIVPPAAIGKKTLLLCPSVCLEHRTFGEPFVRGVTDAPPENVHRLMCLVRPDKGVLRGAEFSGRLEWDHDVRPAAIADVTRVHEWNYVRQLKAFCEGIPDDPAVTANLDGDTALSHRTYRAALAAAGAVTHAVDRVVNGTARHAFCAVRPPGHHAGPTGVVTSANDPNGSHGFCLLNNIAIGAAYAMNVHRHHGIRRVALLDFDVHHGNGTEACVASVVPSTEVHRFSTPFGVGEHRNPVWRPWLDDTDRDNVFFASVQGYGHKAPGIEAFVYPGSGATSDTRPPRAPSVLPGDEAEAEVGPEPALGEDPSGEFVYRGGERPSVGADGPRIINVGVERSGPEPSLWRRCWRDKILPALVGFNPDLILVSAGFDAHKKDEINFGYLSVLEKDFEWLSDQIVQVANRCCPGRVVSALEGGYRIQGGVSSAFARSVAAHVRALCDNHGAIWDPAEAEWERERERARAAQEEAQRLAREEAAADATAVVGGVPPAPSSGGALRGSPRAGSPPAKRRRSGAVDYAALDAQMRAEAEAKAANGGG